MASSTRSLTRRSLPGFGLSLGLTLAYLSAIVLIPLAALVVKASGATVAQVWHTVSDPRVLASLRLSLLASLGGAVLNLVFGVLVAWVLVRYTFPGQRVVDAMVDLPFALPTAVAGIALTKLYAPEGWLGHLLPFKVAYTPLGVLVALTFIGLPFVVRTVQPVLEELDAQQEEAAACLGASRFQTLRRVVLPHLAPALLSGFTLAFARALGEYGSVVFISGNLPFRTEIPPLLIISKLEQYDYIGATVIATLLLLISFVLLFAINRLQARLHPGAARG
ncbi:sulfate ABC transporter permease subunit CysT [Geothrix sp. PMB-07]|uniref:sulfate ABC transporter permease subunit CysT n=1 Tax=Geothrix sp. PMB-07 TaxID=3068640 RepID=UPI002740CEF9|nr:sulfate ABC transporter permease subunit CysT [Geothrix sp. PMB-07]WLT31199.1 sulfate ABC transporter permease subunit CysT [Geothrix sp. PMB-07]